VKYPGEKLLEELKQAGLNDLEIEEAKILFKKGIKLLLKMYYDYEASTKDECPKETYKKAG